MDVTKEKDFANPRDNASFISKLLFSYTLGLFKKGYSKDLDNEDIYNPLKQDRSKLLGGRLQRQWEKELKQAESSKYTPSLLKALVRAFWPEGMLIGLLMVISDFGIRLIQPFLLGGMLGYFRQGSSTTKEEALYYAGGMVLSNLISVLVLNHYMIESFHLGMKLRVASCAAIYKKALKLSKTSLGGTSAGKIVNLLSNDVSRFEILPFFIHQMWIGPCCSLIIMYLLYREVDYAGIIGVIVVFTITPLQSYTGKLSAKYRKQTAMRTDERVRLMDEIVSGIQVIKMYAWEKPFAKVIRWARKAEIKIITKSSYVRGSFMAFNLFTTRCALFCTILTMALMKQEITAAKAFVVMSYFNTISMGMGTMFVRGISEIAELRVSLRRLQAFLMNDEFVPSNEYLANGTGKPQEANKDAIRMKKFSAKWNRNNSDLVLENINISIPRGDLFGVIGPVGSGKSSLLQAILGELEVVQGSYNINGTISYASQEPWIFAATIRQNILFGADYDKRRYADVVRACCLEKDFEQFPEGDHTIVGDRGASLSGGQKARINLARAVYRDADIYLLDDPLSAVDIHVSKRLYEDCINGYLAKKTRVLVTHQVFYLRDNDNIIILNNGIIEKEGTFDDLVNSDHPYSKLLTEEPEKQEKPPVEQEEPEKDLKLQRQMSKRSRKASTISTASELSVAAVIEDTLNEEDEDNDNVEMKVMQEESSKGKVKGNLLLRYMRAGSNVFLVFVVIVLYLLTQLSASGVDYWVNYYVNVEEFIALPNITAEDLIGKPIPYRWSSEERLIVYGVGILCLFSIGLMRSMLFYKMAMLSSKKLHQQVFESVIGSTMRFFDTNPSGRILNRFSKDMGSVDEALPKAILDSTQMLLSLVGAVLLVVIVNPYFLILLAALSVVFGFIRRVYLKTSKNVKRLEGMMRSPVFTHLNATLQGLTTIRAFRQHEILQNEFDKHQDYHSSAWFMFISTSQAFGFYLDCFSFVFNTTVVFSMTALGEWFGLLGGEVGLIINQTGLIAGMLQWGMRQSAEVTNQLLSVERILEYEILPREIQPSTPKIPPKSWPNKGEVIFNEMSLRYFPEGQLVLKHLNFVVKPKEKVGVVGRTGAGKSSLISALFRLAPVEGSVIIDGIDTKDISLETLRKKISIIPQDPVLFSGILRYNLDPFEEYTDENLYRAIEEVELKDPANIINRLENQVMDRGSNYSVGQRQLICLARAIIRNNKILLLDEATANVDPQTDSLIQETIRKKFVDCTVITVAHRLNTIIDSDKVLVMDAGRAVEYDHPHLLLENPNSTFYKMVMETGPSTAILLRSQAKKSYEKLMEIKE